MTDNLNERFWEIDFLRGIAIIAMILFHILYDMYYLGGYDFNLHSGIWFYFARAVASIFLLLVGISLTLSFSKAKQISKGRNLFPKYLKRGLTIFSWGLLITVLTWLFYRHGVILFGILHFIGIAIIIAYPLLRFKFLNLVLGSAFIAIGLIIKNFTVSFPWLLWLGLKPENMFTFDFFPIFPWFGVILVGIFLGNLLYPKYKRKFKLPDLSKFSIVKLFTFLGRHSLFIFLTHQPIVVAILYLIGAI